MAGSNKASSKSRKSKKSTGFSLSTYLEQSREPFTAILLVLPLFVLYQVGVLTTGGIRNGVDFMSDLMWSLAGHQLGAYLGINLGILAAFGIALFILREKGSFHPRIFPYVLGESSVYALLLGSTVTLLMNSLGFGKLLAVGGGALSGESFFGRLILSLGAGLYEETVFRLVLMGGLFWLGLNVVKLPRAISAIIAVVVSSLVFSSIHYIGPLGDPFTLGSFVFRFFAGALLAAIFYLRGFAVAVYTHAIYDVIVMAFHF